MSRILVVDDEAVVRSLLRRLLSRRGHEVELVDSVAHAIEEFDLDAFDLVIADLQMAGAPGTDIIAKCRHTPVLIMASYANVKSAVEAMRLGATDFVPKPFDHDEMMAAVKQALAGPATPSVVTAETVAEQPVPEMIGDCAAIRLVRQRIAMVGPTMANVLISGEAGTGKTLVAKSILAASNRSQAGMIMVNCELNGGDALEAELFGYDPETFDGAARSREGLVEAADGGTLFLDQVAALPPSVQAGLEQVLESGEVRRLGGNTGRRVDLRVLASTSGDLGARVADGRFREDLYHRLRVMEIDLPPLRRRGGDIDVLTRHLLECIGAELGKAGLVFSDHAAAAIRGHSWPGNVGELADVIRRAVSATGDSSIIESVPIEAPVAQGAAADAASGSLDEYFRCFVLDHEAQLTETELARRLGISRKALWERRQRLGIPRSTANDRSRHD